MSYWHPDAVRATYGDVGPFLPGVPAKLVWHTTEGTSLPRYSGSAPHFTFDPKTDKLWQHIPVNRCALTLVNGSGGVETNRARAIQVELIGFSDARKAAQLGAASRAVVNWSVSDYRRIAKLARWIEANAGVERQCSVKFVPYPSSAYPRLSGQQWLAYAGHLGHQHVPENYHGDPSSLRMDLILGFNGAQAANADPCDGTGVLLKEGSQGVQVRRVQLRLNQIRNGARDRLLVIDGDYGPATEQRVRSFQRRHELEDDGVVGPKTWRAVCKAARKERER